MSAHYFISWINVNSLHKIYKVYANEICNLPPPQKKKKLRGLDPPTQTKSRNFPKSKSHAAPNQINSSPLFLSHKFIFSLFTKIFPPLSRSPITALSLPPARAHRSVLCFFDSFSLGFHFLSLRIVLRFSLFCFVCDFLVDVDLCS